MRWTITITVILAAALGSWYFISNRQSDQQLDPLYLIPRESKTILFFKNGEELESIINDTNGSYPLLLEAIGINIQTQKQLNAFKKVTEPLIVATTSEGKFTIITSAGANLMPSTLTEFNLKYWFNQLVISNAENNGDLLEEYDYQLIKKACASFIKPENFAFLFRSEMIYSFIENQFSPDVSNVLKAELNTSNWYAFEGNKEENRLLINGLANIQGDESTRKKSIDLMRYIPTKSGLAIFKSIGETNYAIAYVNYSFQTEANDENVFVFATEPSDSLVAENNYNGIPIKIKAIDFADSLWFKPSWSKQAYQAKIGNVAIYAISFEQLAKLIDDFFADDKLTNSAWYSQLADITSEASFSFYLCPSRLQQPNPFSKFEANRNTPLNALMFQTASELPKQKFYSIAAIHHLEIEDKASIVWSMKLDTASENGPWIFQNHYTKEPEILVQDAKHQLYLINRDGKVLWRKNLEEPIIGELEMIDGFGSGKFQMLFTTASKVHLLDRNGKYVENYPVALLNQTQTAAIAVKYDKNSEYRIIACDGNKLINLNTKGDAVKGWKKPEMKSSAIDRLRHFSLSGKDYIVVRTENNQVYTYDRSGTKLKKSFSLDSNMQITDFMLDKSFESSCFIGFDTLGNIYNQSLDGTLHSKNILPLGMDVGFKATNIRNMAYYTVKGEHFIALDKEFNVVIDYYFPDEMTTEIQIIDKKKGWVALTNTKETHLYIFDLEGKLLDKMPVDGANKSIITDLDLNSSPELITIKHGIEMVAYKLSN